MTNSDIGLSKPERIARTLEREIKSGDLARGSQLASENELVRRFSVSRNTVRKGLEVLAQEGLITTKTGIGSFVTYDGSPLDSALGWTRALAKSGERIETKTVSISKSPCNSTNQFLGLSIDCFLCVDRVRLGQDGVGISLERSRTPWRNSYAEILEHGLVGNSLAQTLAKEGLHGVSGEEWADVLPALSDQDSETMGRGAGESMLRLRRVTRTGDGDLVEFVESILDPKHFGLHLQF